MTPRETQVRIQAAVAVIVGAVQELLAIEAELRPRRKPCHGDPYAEIVHSRLNIPLRQERGWLDYLRRAARTTERAAIYEVKQLNADEARIRAANRQEKIEQYERARDEMFRVLAPARPRRGKALAVEAAQ